MIAAVKVSVDFFFNFEGVDVAWDEVSLLVWVIYYPVCFLIKGSFIKVCFYIVQQRMEHEKYSRFRVCSCIFSICTICVVYQGLLLTF